MASGSSRRNALRIDRWASLSCAGLLSGLMLTPLAQASGAAPAAELVPLRADFRINSLISPASPGESRHAAGSGLAFHVPSSEAVLDGLVPAVLLQTDSEYVFITDLSAHRAYLVENRQRLRVLRDMYATIGKNGIGKQIRDDGRTPLGVYTITSYLTDENLPELYGSGAFPVDYPNHWDRLAGRTGYGIWLHGIPRDRYSRAPRSSEGCVAVPNEDLNSVKPFLRPQQTRVVFSRALEWVTPSELERRRDEFLSRIEAWRAAWSSGNTEAYLAFYADDFRTQSQDRQAFVEHKQRVNAAKSFIEVALSELSAFEYPDQEPLRLVEFTQDYRSDNHRSTDRKRQYWRHDADGQWRIVFEDQI